MTIPLTGRLLNALRSVAVNPKGLRIGAFPKAMAQLVEMGLVEERAVGAKGRGWFLTQAGREEIRQYGTDEIDGG